jgi:acyl carrier protein
MTRRAHQRHLDSLATLGLVSFVEKEFGIELEAHETARRASIASKTSRRSWSASAH